LILQKTIYKTTKTSKMEGMMKLRFEDFEFGGTDSKLVDMVIEMSKDKELMIYSTETPDEAVFEVIIRDELTEEDFTEAIQDACLEFMKFIVKPTKCSEEEEIEGEVILLKTETTEEKIERIEREVVNLLQSEDKKSVDRFEKIQKGMSEVRKLRKLLK
jgi:hypothetical protein